MKQKDAVINNLKKLAQSSKMELSNATEGKETSADPLLQVALQETQNALQHALREKKTSNTAYSNLQSRELFQGAGYGKVVKQIKT
jgi:hypothetical protein